MLSITATKRWQYIFNGSTIGLLEVSGAENSGFSKELEERKRQTEIFLRDQYSHFTRKDFLELPVMDAYWKYYRRFNKTYHVQLQVESIVMKGKNLREVSPLVDANFIAEVETFILTAAHDVAKLNGEILFDVSAEGDQMNLMNGTPKVIYPGDMIMKDNEGICCSIIYGQDNHSLISADTTHALYVCYAPAGVPVDLVEKQLGKIEDNIRLFSQSLRVEQHHLLRA